MPDNSVPINRALISVSDKRGIVPFCQTLASLKIEIVSTGGTAEQLRENGIAVTEVAEYTEFPEIMDGRVKTLHPKIHGGILGRRDTDKKVMDTHHIKPIDLVVVNLYPFQQTVANPDCKLEQAIENIDIGGPTMLRAAAKNHPHVTVVVDPNDYEPVLAQLQADSCRITESMRFQLAVKAFQHTANYESSIHHYLNNIAQSGDTNEKTGKGVSRSTDSANFPDTLNLQFNKKQDMRYGENPHQQAAFYHRTDEEEPAGVAGAQQLQGKEMSFNNIVDADTALDCVQQFTDGFACVIVKHANPCGVAVCESQAQAYQRAFDTDPESAFGGIIAFNQPLDQQTADAIIQQQFVEVIIAPAISDEAKETLAVKSNIRVLACPQQDSAHAMLNYKTVGGGLLVQQADVQLNDTLKVVTKRAPDEAQMNDLVFAWKVAKFVKSNAIVYASAQATIGIGAGQMSRVNSARIAAIKAQHANLEVNGAVLASDAFFPFRDGIEHAAQAGARAVIQPGGSQRDTEVIAAADEHDIAMVFTAMRHFRH